MPRKKSASEVVASSSQSDGAAAGSEDASKKKRSIDFETTALLQWLAQPDNRNIITGAAGMFAALACRASSVSARCAASATAFGTRVAHRTTGAAQNNGGMAGGKLVCSKDQGFALLAKHLSAACGYAFDKKQAQNKYTYLERKFHDAKTWQRTSGVGVTNDDRAKGLCLFFSSV